MWRQSRREGRGREKGATLFYRKISSVATVCMLLSEKENTRGTVGFIQLYCVD